MAEEKFIKSAVWTLRLEIKRLGYNLTLVNTPDEVECRCFYEPTDAGGTPLTEAELQEHLEQFKVSEGIIAESRASLLNSAATAQRVDNLLLARGIPMTIGEDGRVVVVIADDLGEVEQKDEDSATVDFRHVQSFLNVDAGVLIATITPPGSGKPGRTVTAKVIAPQPGEPAKFVLVQNVRLSDDGKEIYSESAGRVCIRGNEISVEDVYEVDGDVDFKVGNIIFKGFVEIKGDVLDGFTIKATKGLKIHGNVGGCTLLSDGDISFCDMNGQGNGKIVCGGSITANFIYDTKIECSGNVCVETEIRSSHIKCLGALSVNKGGLVGGEYFALAGIECGSLGCVTSLRTRVVAGVHYGDLEELNRLFNELKQLMAEFNSAPKEAIDLKEFARRRAMITEQTQQVRSRVHEAANPKINVKKRIHEGANITLGIIGETIAEERKGPCSVIENTIEGGFRFLGMTPLTFKAQAIEETFVQQQQLEEKKKSIEREGAA